MEQSILYTMGSRQFRAHNVNGGHCAEPGQLKSIPRTMARFIIEFSGCVGMRPIAVACEQEH